MFQTNLRNARKQKGMSQEYLAAKLHVVRQTVSKWEKGLSVPDAEMLLALSEALEVSASDLLGKDISDPAKITDVAEQLSQLNAVLAAGEERKSRNKKYLKIGIGILVLLAILCAVYPAWIELWHDFGRNLYRLLHN